MKKRLFGSIQIRDVDNGVPASIKIILSAFLIFPMYRWILFPVTKKLVTVNKFRAIFKKKRPEADLDMKKREATTAEESDEEEVDVLVSAHQVLSFTITTNDIRRILNTAL